MATLYRRSAAFSHSVRQVLTLLAGGALFRYEPRGSLARKPKAKPTSLPDTNINPEMTFKINSSVDLRYNLQDDLQGELRKREEQQLQAVFKRYVRSIVYESR
jgi:hypothetical protein